MKKSISMMAATAALVFTGWAGAQDFSDEETKIKAAMENAERPQRDVERDWNRKPLETLKFFGVQDDMTVVELIPGGGWYTRILAPLLADDGKLYLAYGTGWLGDLLEQPGFEDVKILAKDAKLYRPEDSRFYRLENADMDVKNVDMVLTFRNYHNFDESGRRAMNAAAYAALKPGGIYGVVDHTRRHMEPLNPENARRFDPVLAIKEIQEAGFELVDYTDLHYRPDDELRYEVGRKTVSGNTDRFTLKFRKPE